MSFFRKPFSSRSADPDESSQENVGEISDGSLRYVREKGGNDSLPSYQEATGAPVEAQSPLGYSVGPVTIIFLNISKMIGTGVYSTPSAILKGTGSVGLSLIFWTLGFFTSLASLSVYLEYASYFPNRSGSEVVYLEQSFPRPRWLLPTTFAFQSVVLSFSSGNSIVLAQYIFKINGHTPTSWELKGVAIAGFTIAFLFVAFHTRFSYLFSNVVGIVKVTTLVFISITGLVVLGGHTRVQHPKANFVDAFEGDATPYGVTNALYKIIFSYAGFENAFNVVNEINNPIKQLRRNGFAALTVVATLYVLTNIAFFAAVPKEDMKTASQVAASLFFENVFGSSGAVRGLNFLIALSSFGNLVAVLLGSSRLVRECGRQGILPWPRFWSSTRPFGTPLGPYFVQWSLTMIMILAPPAGDAFNFVIDTRIYPDSVFKLFMGVGIYIVRWRRSRLHLPRPTFRAWHVAVIFNILVNLYSLIMPWYPPAGGANGGDVSFWYGTYVVTGIGILLACALYYWAWIYLIPHLRGYRIRQELIHLEGGAQTHKLVKVPVEELPAWDAEHDTVGRKLARSGSNIDRESPRSGDEEQIHIAGEK